MKISSFIISITDGKIVWKSDYQRDLFLKFVQQFADGQYRLEINQIKSKRTDQQNNYYWLYLNMVSEETGYTPEEVHEWAKGKFLTSGIKEIFGDKVRTKNSTTSLSISGFIEYLLKIEAETGIMLPDTTEFLGYSYHK